MGSDGRKLEKMELESSARIDPPKRLNSAIIIWCTVTIHLASPASFRTLSGG
jgi:hypothetical protein